MPGTAAVLLNLLGRTWAGSTTLPTDVGGYTDDIIHLGGQNLAVRGVSVVEQVAEFESGIKIGPATYDNREHAFFIVMNDFSAGQGFHFVDLREELGGFWYSGTDAANGNALDASREKYILLPPKQTTTTPTAPTSSYVHVTSGGMRNVDLGRRALQRTGATSYSFFLHGSGLYYSLDGGRTLSLGFNHEEAPSGTFVSLLESWESILGTSTLIATSSMNYIYANFMTSGAFIPPGSVGPDTPALLKWTRLTGVPTTDAIWWDGKVLATDPFGIKFGVWTQDTDVSEEELLYNTLNPLDGEYILERVDTTLRFIGSAMAPWGQPSMYFHDERNLYVLDFFARKYYSVALGGFGRSILWSGLWQGEIVIDEGFHVWSYSPHGQTVRDIGLRDKEGLPPSMEPPSSDYLAQWRLRVLEPADKDLWGLMTSSNVGGVPKSFFYKYNGKGWHQIGAPFAMDPSGLFHQSFLNRYRTLTAWGASQMSGTSNMATEYLELPSYSDTPIPGVDSFGDSGADLVTGWMNGGFSDLDGTLLRMKIDGMYLTTTEKFGVEYQLDGDEDSAWIRMVDVDNNEAYFDSSHDTLYFSPTPGSIEPYQPRKGLQFNSVRFRITAYRGSDETLSPVAKAFILMYIKVPEFRLAATFTVDINRMLEATRAGGTEYYVDGAAPTLRSIHQKLISLWDEHLLHQLVVPNVITTADNCYVRIVGMPLRFEDFRDAVDGRGTIELSLIEPLQRAE